MKYLGIDYGERNLGLAISDGILARPYNIKLGTLDLGLRTTEQKLKYIKRIVTVEKIEKIIIGISEGKMAERTRKFGEELKKITGLPVEYSDETLTSQEAVRKMIEAGRGKKFRQEKQHDIAACIILQNYLSLVT